MNYPNTSPLVFPKSWFAIACATAALCALPAHGQIVANFNGGNTSAAVDGYVGMAGGGWAGAWNNVNQAGITTAGTVTGGNPLVPGQGNYLAVELTNTGSSQRALLRRTYQSHGVVALNAQHTINFLLRLDGDLSNITRVNLFDNAGLGAAPDTNSSFFVRDDASGEWRFDYWNGSAAANVRSGVRLFQGDTYAFSLELNPVDQTYVGTVTNLDYAANGRTEGVASFTSTALGFFGANTRTNAAVGGQLLFNVQVAAGSVATPNVFNYSLDAVEITAIPEPSSYAVMAGLAGLCLTLLRRPAR